MNVSLISQTLIFIMQMSVRYYYWVGWLWNLVCDTMTITCINFTSLRGWNCCVELLFTPLSRNINARIPQLLESYNLTFLSFKNQTAKKKCLILDFYMFTHNNNKKIEKIERQDNLGISTSSHILTSWKAHRRLNVTIYVRTWRRTLKVSPNRAV